MNIKNTEENLENSEGKGCLKNFIENHGDVIFEWISVIVFTVLPTLVAVLGAAISSQKFVIAKYYLDGEFLLYSASFLSSAYIIFDKAKKHGKVSTVTIFNRISVFSLLGISASYAFIKASKVLNIDFIKPVSLLSVIVGAGIFYYSLFINSKSSPDIGNVRRSEQGRIEDSLS